MRTTYRSIQKMIVTIIIAVFWQENNAQTPLENQSSYHIVIKDFKIENSSQKDELTYPFIRTTLTDDFEKEKTTHFFDDTFLSGGIVAGQESIFGVKGYFIKPYSFTKSAKKSAFGFYKVGAYTGLEYGGFMFFAIWGEIGVNTGVSLGPFTLDNSINSLFVLVEGPTRYQTTYNPKLGIHLGPVWLKAGPSFLISKESVLFEDWIKIGKYNMNFEIIVTPDFLNKITN